MQDNNTQDKITLIMLLGAFIAIIVALSSIANYFSKYESPVAVTNQKDFIKESKIPAEDMLSIKKELQHVLNAQYGTPEDKKIASSIRDSSIVVKENGEQKSYNFIIDVDSEKVTYAAELYKDEINGDTINFSCAHLHDSKYPDNFCIGSQNHSFIDTELQDALPYVSRNADSGLMDWQLDHESFEKQLNLRIYTACDDEELNKKITASAKAWIDSQGISSDIIPLKVDTSECYNGK